jgi:uncharacterized protein YcsI (UPF0317 family)
VRGEEWDTPTAGAVLGYLQTNLAIVPKEYAYDFLLFCVRNPKPCPIVEVLDEGSPLPTHCAPGADIRTDLPRYRIYDDGELSAEVTNIVDVWRDDFVSFLLGCSFSADAALKAAGVPVEDARLGSAGPMYLTNVPCVSAGPFHGNMVVSLRALSGPDAVRATVITQRLPMAHGAPVHVGDPSAIGIADITKTDYGEFLGLAEEEVPVFWACGVTPQAVARESRIPLMITHSPGHMFVTSLPVADTEW